ncbi:Bone marrow stromal antigen 2, partial [Bos mutus]
KKTLWVGVLLLLVAVGLLVPMIYFAVIANSKACVDGLQAQKECQEVNQHVQRQLTQAQEFSHKKEAEAATCNHTMVTLRESLKKEQAQVAEFQGKLKILNQNLKDALAEVERLRVSGEGRRRDTLVDREVTGQSPFTFSPFPLHFYSTPQSRLQTQLMTLKTEMEEAKAQGTQMGAENGALTGVLGCKGVG